MTSFLKQVSILLLAVALLTGCSKAIQVQLQPEVLAYQSDDKANPFTLTKNDEAYTVLNQWLAENPSGWYSTSGKFPGGIYIVSGEDGIQVTEGRVVLYSIKNGTPSAIYVQEINRSDLMAVKEARNNP